MGGGEVGIKVVWETSPQIREAQNQGAVAKFTAREIENKVD